MRNRVILMGWIGVLAAFAVCGCGSTPQGGARSPASAPGIPFSDGGSAPAPPRWVQAKALRLSGLCGEGRPEGSWFVVVSRTRAALVFGEAEHLGRGRSVYVVVLKGSFRKSGPFAEGGTSAIEGRWLYFTVGAADRQVVTARVGSLPDLSPLGSFTAFEL
jgi:hypothetical protein